MADFYGAVLEMDLGDAVIILNREIRPPTPTPTGESPVITPEAYGAKGDGVTDDTLAIQRCVDENPNSTILFSSGVYCISGTIDLWGASGGQMILLGGATIKWIGEASATTPMLRVSKDYTPTVSSFCRIVGGNLDGGSKAGIGIQNLAFYTDVGGTKILNFTAYGILNGSTDYAITKSTQAKFHDLHIFQRDGDFSAEDTCAIGLSYPDNQISNVVTNRTGTAYRLFSGGNSFSNCHSTIEYRDASSLTAQTFGGKHIEICPANSGTTQENVFSNMYFNAGKYVVFVAERATNLVTHIASSHYTYYKTADLPFRGEGYLYAGKPGVFVCDSFDVMVGGNFDFYDYFPETAPTETTVPRKLEINQNHRHPEASIFSANNYCTESSKPRAIANTTNPIPQSGQYYLVGAILESYTPSASLEDRYQGAVKIEWSATDNHNEAVITFDNGEPKIAYEMVGAITPDHMVYIGTVASTVTIDSVTYNWYPIYVYASAGVAYRMTLKAYSLDYYTKCYVRSHLTSEIQPESDPGEMLRLGETRGVTVSQVNLLSGEQYQTAAQVQTAIENALAAIPSAESEAF